MASSTAIDAIPATTPATRGGDTGAAAGARPRCRDGVTSALTPRHERRDPWLPSPVAAETAAVAKAVFSSPPHDPLRMPRGARLPPYASAPTAGDSQSAGAVRGTRLPVGVGPRPPDVMGLCAPSGPILEHSDVTFHAVLVGLGLHLGDAASRSRREHRPTRSAPPVAGRRHRWMRPTSMR
jgi:hypothetical protein